MKLLLIEDDQQVQDFVIKGMQESGHTIDTTGDGKDGLFMATTEQYDVIILDRMLPSLDGITILKTLRGADNSVPVLLLSALGEVDDRVTGLRAGSDDYLVKPFAFAELLARVESLNKRGNNSGSADKQTTLSVADLHMDLLARKVTRAGEDIDLQTREFALLEYLLKHKGKLVTRTMMLEAVWNYHFDPQTNVIDVHISRLRKKIGDTDSTLIKTNRGSGYIIEDKS